MKWQLWLAGWLAGRATTASTLKQTLGHSGRNSAVQGSVNSILHSHHTSVSETLRMSEPLVKRGGLAFEVKLHKEAKQAVVKLPKSEIMFLTFVQGNFL